VSRREWGNDVVPDYILQQQQKRHAEAAKVRAAEIERDNAAGSYDFLKLYKARVAITIGGVTFEAIGDDVDDLVTQARLRLFELRQAEADATSRSRSLSFGT
jgi:hypothetical protein